MQPDHTHTILASQCISPYFLEAWNLPGDMLLETETVSARELLNVNRFDLFCKLYYIDCLEHGRDLRFAKELYQAHIEAFSEGTFIEPGIKTKNSIQDYFEKFNQMIASIRDHGFDESRSLVPVGDDGVILDGSHRTAIAIYYNVPLTVVHIPGRNCQYNYAYFREKGMNEVYLDFMAYQYIRFEDPVYTVCLWPAAYDVEKLRQVEHMIRSCADIAFQKELKLNYQAVEQLMISFYHHMAWTGTVENGFQGVASKAKSCFQSGAPTTVYVIGGAKLDEVLALKQRIRDLYAIENSSVHITDTHEEALEAGKLLLHRNSVDFMNLCDPYQDPVFMKDFVQTIASSRSCASYETALALYGINGRRIPENLEAGEELFDPREYFYFWGVQVPALGYLKTQLKKGGSTAYVTLQQIERFERRNHSFASACKEYVMQSLQNISVRSTQAIGNLKSESHRLVKVCYHRIKYREQNRGKAKKNIEDLKSVFLNVNTTTAEYLILRNWEGFYDDILLEGHNDIDLLCRDTDSRDIIVRLLDARPLTDDGFHYAFQYRGRQVTLDTRILGDGYYDRRWQRDMLRHKRLHPQGFYVMDSENYYYSLIYHAIYQKKDGMSDEYSARLNRMSPSDQSLSQPDFAAELGIFMQRKHYGYTKTKDQSVVKNFGITDIPKKIRYPLNIRLYHALQHARSLHIWQHIKIKLRKIIRG